MNAELYIWIPNWDGPDGFQHYKERDPIWIKNYVKLLAKDEYLALTSHRRGVLHGVWLAYASSNRRLRADPRSLSSRLQVRVMSSDLESLNHAEFIEVIASNVLAGRLQAASPHARPRARVEAEAEKEIDKSSEATLLPPAADGYEPNGLPFSNEILYQRLLAFVGSHGDDNTPAVIRSYVNRASERQLAKILESAEQAHARNRAKYVVGALKAEIGVAA